MIYDPKISRMEATQELIDVQLPGFPVARVQHILVSSSKGGLRTSLDQLLDDMLVRHRGIVQGEKQFSGKWTGCLVGPADGHGRRDMAGARVFLLVRVADGNGTAAGKGGGASLSLYEVS